MESRFCPRINIYCTNCPTLTTDARVHQNCCLQVENTLLLSKFKNYSATKHAVHDYDHMTATTSLGNISIMNIKKVCSIAQESVGLSSIHSHVVTNTHCCCNRYTVNPLL